MPITPFHFGAGILLKGLSPTKHFSWVLFALTNIAIDLEPIIGFLVSGDPIHRYAHTYLGATLIGVIVAVRLRKPSEVWLRVWNAQMNPAQLRWFGVVPGISNVAALTGALAGAWSHVWLDSYMHVDVMPWWPVHSANEYRGIVALDVLHWGLVAMGLIGGVILVVRRIRT